MENMLKYALKVHSKKTGIDFEELNKNMKYYADGRFKIQPLSITCTWDFNQNGIFRYKNVKYFYRQEKYSINVERV